MHWAVCSFLEGFAPAVTTFKMASLGKKVGSCLEEEWDVSDGVICPPLGLLRCQVCHEFIHGPPEILHEAS